MDAVVTWTEEDREFFHMMAAALERRSFQAKLEDLGYEDCEVCECNRRRLAWEPE